MIKKLLFLAFIFISVTSFAQNINLSENAKVSIFTCGRGDELYTTFPPPVKVKLANTLFVKLLI